MRRVIRSAGVIGGLALSVVAMNMDHSPFVARAITHGAVPAFMMKMHDESLRWDAAVAAFNRGEMRLSTPRSDPSDPGTILPPWHPDDAG